MAIYLIPGLGFDERMFDYLNLPEHQLRYLNWQEPQARESLGNYARRMADNITADDENPILIGHSFGGILSQEIAHLRPIRKVILLSSLRDPSENPWHFRILAPLGMVKWIKGSMVEQTIGLWGKAYGYETAAEQDLVVKMVTGYSNHYLQWALGQLSRWSMSKAPDCPVCQIHGTSDRTFPFSKLKAPDHVVKDGGHFMAYNRAETINALIRQELDNFTTPSTAPRH